MSNIRELEIQPLQYLDGNVGPCNKARRDGLRANYTLPEGTALVDPINSGIQHDALLDYTEKIRELGVCEEDVKNNIRRKQEELGETNGKERARLIRSLGVSLQSSARNIAEAMPKVQRSRALIRVERTTDVVVFKKRS